MNDAQSFAKRLDAIYRELGTLYGDVYAARERLRETTEPMEVESKRLDALDREIIKLRGF